MAEAAQTDPNFYFQGRHTPDVRPPEVVDNPPADEIGLGLLADLLGTWTGAGFNTIWRPHQPADGSDRFLELNLTTETLVFTEINGPVPNRGLLMSDIDMFGLTYMQQIAEAGSGAGLHVEPGIWLNVPQTSNPAVPPSVVRMASIPHGTTVLAQGTSSTAGGGPQIPDTNIIPFSIGQPPPPNSEFGNAQQQFAELNLSVASQFRQVAPEVTQAMVENPNSVLRDATQGVNVTQTAVLQISSLQQPVPGGGTANTAFLEGTPGSPGNANAAEVDATFWIETVAGADGAESKRLQYSQLVQLDFNGLRWPHVTVATLTKN